jgi:hypothetical protein
MFSKKDSVPYNTLAIPFCFSAEDQTNMYLLNNCMLHWHLVNAELYYIAMLTHFVIIFSNTMVFPRIRGVNILQEQAQTTVLFNQSYVSSVSLNIR